MPKIPKNIEIKTYSISRESEKALEFTSRTIFETYAELSDSLISLEQACKKDICELSPLQVAYIGHIDFLELEQLQIQIKEVFREKSITEQIETLRTMARDVVSDPANYKKQITLRRQLELFAQELDSVRTIRSTLADDLVGRAKKLREAIGKLRAKPYEVAAKELSDGDIVKFQILMRKLDSELSQLEKIPSDITKFTARVQRAGEMLERLNKGYLGQMPTKPEDWKELSENFLVELDRLGK